MSSPERQGPPRLGYRCVFRNEYPGDENHPKSLFVAENRILPVLDEWLRKLSSKNLKVTVAAMMEHKVSTMDSHPKSDGHGSWRARLRPSWTVTWTPSRRAWIRPFTSSGPGQLSGS